MRSIFPEKMPKAVMPTVLMLAVLSFVPLSLAVGFAMVSSYLLWTTRTTAALKAGSG